MNTRNIMDRFSIQDIKRVILAQDGRNVEARRFVNMLIGGTKKDFGRTEQIRLGCCFDTKNPDVKKQTRSWFEKYQENEPPELCSWFYEELAKILLQFYNVPISGGARHRATMGKGDALRIRKFQTQLKNHIIRTLGNLTPKKVDKNSLELAKCPDSTDNKDIVIQENWFPRGGKNCNKLKNEHSKQQVFNEYPQLQLPDSDDEKRKFVASARLTLIKCWYTRWQKIPQLNTKAEKDNNIKLPRNSGRDLPTPYVFIQLDTCMQTFKPNEESRDMAQAIESDVSDVSKDNQDFEESPEMARAIESDVSDVSKDNQNFEESPEMARAIESDVSDVSKDNQDFEESPEMARAIKDALPQTKEDLGYEELLHLNDVDSSELCKHFESMTPQYFNNQAMEIIISMLNDVDDNANTTLKPYVEQAQAYFGGAFMYPSQCSRMTTDVLDKDEEDSKEDNTNFLNDVMKILGSCNVHDPKQAKCYLHKLYASVRITRMKSSDDESSDDESSDDENSNKSSGDDESNNESSGDDESSDASSSNANEEDEINGGVAHKQIDNNIAARKTYVVTGISRKATMENVVTFIRELINYDQHTPNNVTPENEDSINDIGYPEWVADLSRKPDIDEIKSCEGWFGPPGLDVRDIFMSDIGVINTSVVDLNNDINIQPKNIIVFHKMDCLVKTNNACKEECRYVLQTVPFHRYPNKDIVICDIPNNCVWKKKDNDEEFQSISFDEADKRTRRLIKMAKQKYDERQNQLPDARIIASLARRVRNAENALGENSSASENMEGGYKMGTNSIGGKSVQGLGKKTGQPVRHVTTGSTPALEKSLEKVEKIIKARHVPCQSYHKVAKELEEGIKKYYKHPYLENQIRKGITLLERLYNVTEKQSGAPTGKRLYNRCFSLTGRTTKLGQYQFKIHKPMKGPRKNGRPKKTIDPNKPKRRKRVRLQPQFCDWNNKVNEVSEKGLKYKACKGDDKKRRPCGVKRKGNWILYNRGENCTVVKRGEKWRVKNENNALQAYQVKGPTTTNAPKAKRPRRTNAPKPSAKPLASSTQDQDQVSGNPFAKILGRRSKSSGSKLPELGLGPIDEEESNDPLANNSLLADPIEIFDSPIGKRKRSVIPSNLGTFAPIDLSNMSGDKHASKKSNINELLSSVSNVAPKADSQVVGDNNSLLNRQSNQKRTSIGTQGDLLGDDAPLNALSSSNDNTSSTNTSNDFAQYAMQQSPTSNQGNPIIDDFNNVDVDNLDPDVLEMYNNNI
jgi:hypothetical protein